MAKFNFRLTELFVTDAVDETFVVQNDNYPTARDTHTFGWLGALNIQERDRDELEIPQLAGSQFIVNNIGQETFIFDSGQGTFDLRVALGDATFGALPIADIVLLNASNVVQSVHSVLATGVLTLNSDQYVDATGVMRTNWAANNLPLEVIVGGSATKIGLRVGDPALTLTSTTAVAHLSIEPSAPTRSISDIDTDNDVQAGQSTSITGVDFDLPISSVTLGGQPLTVTGTPTTTNIDVTVPLHTDLKTSQTYDLVVNDNTGALTKTGVTFSLATGWEEVIYDGSTPPVGDVGFLAEALAQFGIVMVAGDSWVLESWIVNLVNEMSVAPDGSVEVVSHDPPVHATGSFKVWDVSAGGYSAIGTYLWTDAGAVGQTVTMTLGGITVVAASSTPSNDLTSAGTIDEPLIAVHVNVLVDDLVSSGSIDTPVITGNASVSVDSLASGATLDEPVIQITGALVSDDLTSASTLGTPSVVVHTSTAVNDLTSSGTLDSPGVTGNILLAIDSIVSNATLDSVGVTQNISAAANDLVSAGELDTPSATSHLTLVVNNLRSEGSLDTPAVSFGSAPSNDLVSGATLELVSVTQHTAVLVDDLVSNALLESPSVVGNGFADISRHVSIKSLTPDYSLESLTPVYAVNEG